MERVIDHAVVGVIAEKDGRFLFVQETKPDRAGKYNVPGGHVEPHETLFEAAVRETKEESGYDVELIGLLGVYQTILARINVSGPVFAAKIVGGEATTSTAHPAVKWFNADEVKALAENGKLFTTYPPHAIGLYQDDKILPLDAVTCERRD